MVTALFSTILLGRNRGASVRFVGVAVICGVLVFGTGWVLDALGQFEVFSIVVIGALGLTVAIAAAHTYENSGLVVSWMLFFWPTAGAAAFATYRHRVNTPLLREKSYLLGDVIQSGVYGEQPSHFSVAQVYS